MQIRPLQQNDAQGCDAVVLSLPWHFAQEDGRAECAHAVRSSEGLVADLDGRIVGFITFERHFESAGEITWLAIENSERRNGIGRNLVDAAHGVLESSGVKVMSVLTVSPNEPEVRDDGYGATRRFYESCGYVLTKEFTDLWPGDKAVLMTAQLGNG